MKYFRIIPNGYHECGNFYAPDAYTYPLAHDAVEIVGWKNLVLELKDGTYVNFQTCVSHANLVSEELKELFVSFLKPDAPVEFLPVQVRSKEYGDKIYYILHFKIIYDVIDYENCICNPPGSIIKVALDEKKVNGLHIFNSQPIINDVIISNDVRKAMVRKKLNPGVIFQAIYCS